MTTDSPLAVGFYYQPNNSGDNGTKPCAYGVHSIECPPAIKEPGNGWYDRKYASLMGPNYMQNPATQASVQYGLFGSVAIQGLRESWWAWGMGTPASRYTTHVEQAGYSSFSAAQWAGLASAVGYTYTRASDGVVVTYTEADREAMAAQFDLQARMYADWCHRNGYTPKLGTMDELLRTTQGEQLGIAFTHSMASQLPNTTTDHHDPGPDYPMTEMVDLATHYFSGAPTPTPSPTPSTDWLDMATQQEVQAALTAALKAQPPAQSGWAVFSPTSGGIGATVLGSRVWSGLGGGPAGTWAAFQAWHKAQGLAYQNMGRLTPAEIAQLVGKQV